MLVLETSCVVSACPCVMVYDCSMNNRKPRKEREEEKAIIKDVPQDCLICGHYCINRKALCMHVAMKHDVGRIKGYIDTYILHNEIKLCKCGCGEPTTWNAGYICYNDYINGHNETGASFRIKQPDFTQEQIDRRNDAIRKSYTDNGDEIKSKISTSVLQAYEDPIKRANIEKGRYEATQTEKFRQSCSDAQKIAWSGEAGQARKEKVFTKEFGRKIALANMRRDSKKVSMQELKFVEQLKTIFDPSDVESSKWFNFTEKTWCVDAYIRSLNLLVEFDGVYWHGLDRKDNFTHAQLVHIANDIRKNKIARDHKLNFIRISSNTDISDATCLKDLLSLAHHVVIDGVVKKESTFKIDEHTPFVSREQLIRLNEVDLFPDAPGREFTEKEMLPAIREVFRAHVEYWGWFYPEQTETLSTALQNLSRVPMAQDTVSNSTHGTKFLKAFVKSYWDVDGGPRETFFVDKYLNSVLRYRLGLNNSKPYEYDLSDGTHVSCKETFDINLATVRFGFIVQRNSVSWFRPATGVSIYKKYLQGIEAPVVWDPSIGFSARLLSFASACPDGMYIGTDPALPMYNDARKLAVELKSVCPKLDVRLMNQGSEKPVPIALDCLDFVFTSPPYFDKEQYLHEEGQCWLDYPTKDKWIEFYLIPTFKNAFRCLKVGRTMAINVTQSLSQDVIDAAISVGFVRTIDNDCKLVLKKDHFSKKMGAGLDIYEPILTFVK